MLRPFDYLVRVCLEDFVKNAVANNGLALEFVSGGRIQQALVLAISFPKDWCRMVAGYILSHLAFGEPGLSNDKDVCMEAVSERGEALIHCSAQMRVLDQGLQLTFDLGYDMLAT